MKILADANPVYTSQLTGIGYLTDELLTHLSKITELEGFAFNFKGKKVIKKSYKVQEQKKLPGKLLSYPRYLNVDVPLKHFFDLSGADVVLGTNYILPPTNGVPSVAMVHDLCFIDHPKWVEGRNALILRKMLGKTLRRSTALITISEFSAMRIRDIYGYTKPILVISIPPKKSTEGQSKPRLLHKIADKKFFLFVSTIEPRKNISTLLDAFEALPKKVQAEYPLVLAGKPGWDKKSLIRLRSSENTSIYYLDYVSESERNWLYSHAAATVIPSHYEGFGMMTLESLYSGTPTILSKIPPHLEILGDKGSYFEHTDTSELTKLLHKFTAPLVRDKAYKEQSIVLKDYSWAATAKTVAEFLEEHAV